MRVLEKAPLVWCAFLVLDALFVIGFFKAKAIAKRFVRRSAPETFGTQQLPASAMAYRLAFGFVALAITALLLFAR
jgi:hypothetical protein